MGVSCIAEIAWWMLIRTTLSIVSRCIISSFHWSATLKVHYRFGMAVFLLQLPFKVWVFVSNSGTVVPHVLFHPLALMTSASSTHPESIISPLISVIVRRMALSINALKLCVPAGSLPHLIGRRWLSLSTALTHSTNSHYRGKRPPTTFTIRSFTKPTTLGLKRWL